MVEFKSYYVPRACLLYRLPLLLLALWNKCSPQQAILSPPQPVFFSPGDTNTHITTRRTEALYPHILIFTFYTAGSKIKDSELNGSKYFRNLTSRHIFVKAILICYCHSHFATLSTDLLATYLT